MDPSSTNNRSRTDQSDKPNQHKTNLSEKSTIIIFILNQNKSEPLTIPITKHAVNINANNILFVLLEYIFTIYKAHISKTSSGDIQKEPTNMADSICFSYLLLSGVGTFHSGTSMYSSLSTTFWL